MLFDLKTGKRRRVVQVVFGFLAFIFFISFVGFGIGSDVSGGIFDAIGLGGNSNDSSTDSQYEQQIDDAESKVADDPKDVNALNDLAYFRYQSGAAQLDIDEEAQTATVTEETRSEWSKALDAWEDLLALKPKKLEPQTVSVVQCIYVPPNCGLQATEDAVDFAGAIKTQELLVEEDPSAQNLALLAYFQLADGEIEEGKATGAKAVSAAEGAEAKELQKSLDKLTAQAEKIQKASDQAAGAAGGDSATGDGSLQSPFGGLSPDSGLAPPTSP